MGYSSWGLEESDSLAGNEHPSLSPSDWNSLEEACLEGKDGFREIQSESLGSPTTRGP